MHHNGNSLVRMPALGPYTTAKQTPNFGKVSHVVQQMLPGLRCSSGLGQVSNPDAEYRVALACDHSLASGVSASKRAPDQPSSDDVE
jgi:hypothetical protein